MRQFRPTFACLKYKLKYKHTFDWNFVVRQDIPNIMDKIFGKLHYLGSHSYVTEKWYKHESKFLKQHPNRF